MLSSWICPPVGPPNISSQLPQHFCVWEATWAGPFISAAISWCDCDHITYLGPRPQSESQEAAVRNLYWVGSSEWISAGHSAYGKCSNPWWGSLDFSLLVYGKLYQIQGKSRICILWSLYFQWVPSLLCPPSYFSSQQHLSPLVFPPLLCHSCPDRTPQGLILNE